MGHRGMALAALAAFVGVCTSAPASSSESSFPIHRVGPHDIESRRAQLFQHMMAEPTNLDIAFEYAQLSARVGDLEGAISTLERMLIFAPGLPRLQLELGVLYYRLGSYETARSYLELAAASPDTPPEVHAQVEQYIRQINIEADPPALTGTLFSAIRWQDNATSAPDSNTVTLNGLPFVLDPESAGKADWSVLNVGTVSHVWDLKRQGDRIDTDLLAYSQAYFDQHEVNLHFFEGLTGPSWNMKRFGVSKTRLHTYAIGNAAILDEDYYFSSAGGGVRLLSFARERSIIDLRVETRVRWFDDTPERPVSSLRDGPQTRLNAIYTYAWSPRLTVSVQTAVQREDLDAGFYSNWEYNGSLTATYAFGPPLRSWRGPWALQLAGGYIFREYDDPDFTINFSETEEDETWWGRASLIVPVTETIALVPQVEYRDQSSNYDIRDFSVFTALVGLQKRF